MINFIDLSRSKQISLPSLTNEANSELSKGWSLSYVYFFRELRDIYLLIEKYGYKNNSTLLDYCKKEKIYPMRKDVWTERNILERANALKNFGLITIDGCVKDKIVFSTNFGDELDEKDMLVFKNIFFKYFRFREILTWMINPYELNRLKLIDDITEDYVIENSKVIFPFIGDGRFTNSFFFELKDNSDVFFIKDKDSDLMRFWDVFVKWGITLGIMDKFQLKWVGIKTIPDFKSLTCLYVKKSISKDFSIIDFIKMNYRSSYIYIPELIMEIILKYRYSLVEIKELIVSQCVENKELISMQRTSEIFVEEKEKILLPMHRNSYISHLLLL